MNNLIIEPTNASLSISLNAEKNLLEFVGESRPENVKAFFIPVLDWIVAYTDELASTNQSVPVKASFKLEYFNSSSAKFILDIIATIDAIKLKAPNVTTQIDWLYASDDEDLFDSGNEFTRLSGIPMNFVSY